MPLNPLPIDSVGNVINWDMVDTEGYSTLLQEEFEAFVACEAARAMEAAAGSRRQ